MCYIGIWWSWIHKNVFKCMGWPFVKMYEFLFLSLAYMREFPCCFCLMVLLVLCFTSSRIWSYYCFIYLSYFVGLHFVFFFCEYYLSPSLSIVSTSVLINLRFSVFPLLIYCVDLFRVNIPTVWFFNILISFLGFQCPPPQFVPIFCAHWGLALISQ